MNFLDNISKKDIEQYDDKVVMIKDLLKENRRLVSFVGSSQSGTSFFVNTIASFLAMQGIEVAILDATKNKSSYFIYTKNEEVLRRTATESIDNLSNGIANGIKVNEHLTVYTSLPAKYDTIKKVEPILQTLLKNHTLILVDCDFDTPMTYFSYSQEIYLVQTMDILTIQPLTELLLKMKNNDIQLENKIRVIVNKYVTLENVSEREIVSGISFYNDPSMSFMRQLLNKANVKYCVVPFVLEAYTKYLNCVANCNIDVRSFPQQVVQMLTIIANNICPALMQNRQNNNLANNAEEVM